jgi:hypothetical protein
MHEMPVSPDGRLVRIQAHTAFVEYTQYSLDTATDLDVLFESLKLWGSAV